MALVPYVYKDAALTQQFDDAIDQLGAEALNGSSGDGSLYYGSPNAAIKIQADSDPGVDPINVSIVDASPGSGVEAAHIRLALSQAGLAGATPGAPVSLGDTVLGGVANAVRLWWRWDNSIGGADNIEISLSIVPVAEVAV